MSGPAPDPRALLSAWLPHLLLIALLGLGVTVLTLVFQPVLEPILLAAALALLTGPVLFQPAARLVHVVLPRLSEGLRLQLAGMLATGVLVALVVSPLLLVLASLTGGIDGIFALGWGIVVKDQAQIDQLGKAVKSLIDNFDKLYPRLDLPSRDIPGLVRSAIAEASDFGTTALGFLFRGTGTVAQVVLALVMLAFLYAQGPRLVHALLDFSPLAPEQKAVLLDRHRQIVLRLLSDTVATALARGIVFGLVAWGVDRGLGTGVLPVVPVILMAAFIALLPLVGSAMVWVPLTVFEATSEGGGWLPASVLAVSCIAAGTLLSLARARVGRRITERGQWMGFLLFLGLVGGLLSFGVKGFVIGPMSVVFVYTLASFWLPLYGVGRASTVTSPAVDSSAVAQASDPCPMPVPPQRPT